MTGCPLTSQSITITSHSAPKKDIVKSTILPLLVYYGGIDNTFDRLQQASVHGLQRFGGYDTNYLTEEINEQRRALR